MLNSLKNSEAYREFVCSRCEEILSQSEESSNMSKNVIAAEEKLRKTLTADQLVLFREYETRINEHHAYNETLIYNQALSDRNEFT